MAKTYPRLLVFNDPYAMRINRELADEIGLNESVVLLQLEYLISRWGKERGGRLWLTIAQKQLRDDFPWWSQATVCRILQNLRQRKLIEVDNLNDCTRDRTQWYALCEEGIGQLGSIRLIQNGLSPAENKAKNGGSDSNLNSATSQIDELCDAELDHADSQDDDMLKKKENHHLKNHLDSTITSDNSLAGDRDGGDGGPGGIDSGEPEQPQERTPLEAWLGDEVGLVTAREFRDWPEEATRARVQRLIQGGANQAMIVTELRARKRQIFDQAIPSCVIPDDLPSRPDWIADADWLLLTDVQRDAYAESRLNPDGSVAGRYPELDGVINGRFKVTTERLVQARRGEA